MVHKTPRQCPLATIVSRQACSCEIAECGWFKPYLLRHVCCLFRTMRFRLGLLCRLMVRKGWTQLATRDPGLRSWKPRWLQLGSPIRRIRASSTLCRRHALAEVQPVQDFIASTESFTTRVRKCVETERTGVETAKAEFVRRGRSEIGFRGGRVEQGRAPSRGIATGSEDCASVKTILSGSEQSASRRGGRVQEDAGSHRILPAGALSIEVGAFVMKSPCVGRTILQSESL